MRSAARVCDRAPDLLLVGAGPHRVEQRSRHDLGIVVEQLPAERPDVAERAAANASLVEGSVERVDRAPRDRGVVVGIAPLAELLGTARRRRLADERREDLAGRVLAEVFDRLERLVGEVDRVAAVDEHVVGHRREHHVLDVGETVRLGQCGLERALGRVGRAGFDEAPVPGFQPVAREALRLAARRPRIAAHGCSVSRATKPSPCTSASAWSSASRWGRRLAIATSTVSPAPQPWRR